MAPKSTQLEFASLMALKEVADTVEASRAKAEGEA
jgi:hypothetical protein